MARERENSIDVPDHYQRIRRDSEALCEPLTVEDYGVQPMADASPPKWHLAHTSWFFETFLLKPYLAGYEVFHPRYEYLFNSYYNGIGNPYPRAARGLLSRPTVADIRAYRAHVDDHMAQLLATAEADRAGEVGAGPQVADTVRQRTTLGLHHERQHQELLLTDIKYNLGNNPLMPAYQSEAAKTQPPAASEPMAYIDCAPGAVTIGGTADEFAFDNELPRHDIHLLPYALADCLATNGDYLEFVLAGGYYEPGLWLSDGWSWLNETARPRLDELRADDCAERRFARCTPLYWYKEGAHWYEYRLTGATRLELSAPVCHVSFYEADAFARWSGARLPLESEWEAAVTATGVSAGNANFVDSGRLHPRRREPSRGQLAQAFGDVWEWTASPYVAYPRYQPLAGTLGEYNGKFMSNQLVLRGGSCASSSDHIRVSYRNFFYPKDRWQFTGIRLARDV